MLNSQIFDHVEKKSLRLSVVKNRQFLDSFCLQHRQIELKMNIQVYRLKLNTFKRKDCPEYIKRNFDSSILLEKIKIAENELKNLRDQIFLQRKFEHLMHKHGWSEFDCSDYIEDYSSKSYIPFIGTQEEFNQLKEILNVQ